jgi:DUF4097 and DUF4098 domain-containing protein YvlB
MPFASRMRPGLFSSEWAGAFLGGVLAILLVSPGTVLATGAEEQGAVTTAGQRLSTELSGTVGTREGQRLHLNLDLGSIVVRTQNANQVDYHVHLETDASQKDAKQLLKNFAVSASETSEGVYMRGQTFGRHCSGRLWVTMELSIPRNYSLDISTGGGNIETEDINGRVSATTAGGNIIAGNIGGPARLETDGGHISVKNVAGELYANTGGGHITTGVVSGGATLHTGGGHIRVASVDGVARLTTGGGNVTLEHSGTELFAETLGGQIEVGEAAGLVRAKTGGGGIRVVRVSGPTNLETGGGSIYLTQVDGAVRATTGTGGITAWFVSQPKRPGACDLQSGDGDIVVYLPRQLPITIDAQIQLGDEHHVIADPAFPLKVSYDDASNGSRRVHAEGALNGGGEVLRLRTVAGNIRLMLSDSNKQVELYKQQMAQLQQKMDSQLRMGEKSLPVKEDQP